MVILNGGGIGKDVSEYYKLFSDNLNTDKPLLYIPLAWKDETYSGCSEFVLGELKPYGINNLYMLTDLNEFDSIDINQYSGIFIGGGNTYKLLNYLKKSNGYNFIQECIDNDVTIFGGSAGAIIFGYDIRSSNICSKDINHWPELDTKGFDLLEGKSIACHYENTEQQNQNIEQFSVISEVKALKESESIVVNKKINKNIIK